MKNRDLTEGRVKGPATIYRLGERRIFFLWVGGGGGGSHSFLKNEGESAVIDRY